MALGWRGAIERGLGNWPTLLVGLPLIALGVLGKVVLFRYANIETVFVASLLAGSLLGRWWTVIVPLSVMLILQSILWGGIYTGYALETIFGITFFVVTGFVFVGLAGRGLKRRIALRVKSVALLTTVSVPLTVAYDLWTDIGEWYFIARPAGVDFLTVLELQVPFTLYHLLSSLVFVPIFGSLFLVLQSHLAEAPAPERVPQEDAVR